MHGTPSSPAAPPPRSGALRIGAALALLAAAMAAFVWSRARSRTDASTLPAYHVLRDGGLRYEYDAIAGRESLFVEGEPADVAASRPADVERLRGKLLDELGIEDLSVLRAAYEDVAEALNRLGYLSPAR